VAQFVVPRPDSGSSSGPPTAVSPEAARHEPPRWRDGRVLLGLALIVSAMLIGSRVLSTADARTPVWTFTHHLSAKSVVTDDDVTLTSAGVDGNAYLTADHSPIGQRVAHEVEEGEYVAASALASNVSGDRRLVTVSVDTAHAPTGLTHGERVDVWVTPKDDAASLAGNAAPQLVLAGALVDEVPSIESFGAASVVPVVLDVPNAAVARLVMALHHGDLDLIRLPANAS